MVRFQCDGTRMVKNGNFWILTSSILTNLLSFVDIEYSFTCKICGDNQPERIKQMGKLTIDQKV